MKTMSEMAKNVGQYGLYVSGDGLRFRVRVVDARVRFGEVDYLIVPTDGLGEKWVAGNKVRFSDYVVTEVN